MAEFQILSWHELPAQIRVRNGKERVQIELPSRFQERIDAEAMKRGLVDSDAYLDGWKWSAKQQRDGSAKEVAEALQRELEEAFPG